MESEKRKCLVLAIVLNIILPGAGYVYVGKVLQGIAALFLVGGIVAVSNLETVGISWVIINIVMVIDMVMLLKGPPGLTKNSPANPQ